MCMFVSQISVRVTVFLAIYCLLRLHSPLQPGPLAAEAAVTNGKNLPMSSEKQFDKESPV